MNSHDKFQTTLNDVILLHETSDLSLAKTVLIRQTKFTHAAMNRVIARIEDTDGLKLMLSADGGFEFDYDENMAA